VAESDEADARADVVAACLREACGLATAAAAAAAGGLTPGERHAQGRVF